jgi:hypothetical protein
MPGHVCQGLSRVRLESRYICLGLSLLAMLMRAVEIFLPSYADYHFDDLERRQDPVEDIILTDEEVKNMFPS